MDNDSVYDDSVVVQPLGEDPPAVEPPRGREAADGALDEPAPAHEPTDIGAEDIGAEEIDLPKDAQVQVAGLVAGIMTIKPSDDDPAVRLALRNLATGESAQAVFVPNAAQSLLAHTVEVLTIHREPPTHVTLRVQPDRAPA